MTVRLSPNIQHTADQFLSWKLEETVANFTLLPSLSLSSPLSQANSNEIVLASTHDVQEVDVSTLVAVQPYTWIGEDFDKESRRSDHLLHLLHLHQFHSTLHKLGISKKNKHSQ